MSPRSLVRALRLGQYPGFDDVYVPQLRRYVDQHRADMLSSLGQGGLDDLQQAISEYELAARRWYAGERRLLGRLLRTLFRFVDVPTWLGGAKRLRSDAEQRATDELQGAIARWRADGHLTSEQRARLDRNLRLPPCARSSCTSARTSDSRWCFASRSVAWRASAGRSGNAPARSGLRCEGGPWVKRGASTPRSSPQSPWCRALVLPHTFSPVRSGSIDCSRGSYSTASCASSPCSPTRERISRH